MPAGVSADESAVGRDSQIIKRTRPGTEGIQIKPDTIMNIIMNSCDKHVVGFLCHDVCGSGRTESFFRHGDSPDGSVL